jgi:elongation factor G
MASSSATPRTALICGPYLSGKTSLFEALRAEAAALHLHDGGSGFNLGDSTPEAKARGMSTEMNVATADYLGERWTFLDCPGSVDLMQDMRSAMEAADIAVVVVEPEPEKAIILSVYLKMLEEAGVPHILFINKFDKKNLSVRTMLEALQAASAKPLVLREVPIHEGEDITGFVDLVSERAFHYEEGKHSSLIQIPDSLKDREHEARTELMEHLADFNDDLLEKLLEDTVPSTSELYANLTKDLKEDLVVPVFFGSATQGHGIHRLMKALRHEAPHVGRTAERMGIDPEGPLAVKVLKTIQAGHAGKVSIARVLAGSMKSGDVLNKERPASINKLFGRNMEAVQSAGPGDVIGLGKMDSVNTGDLLSTDGKEPEAGVGLAPPPLFSLAIRAENRADDVRLPDNLKKVMEEDPSLSSEFDEMSGEQILSGQGEMHLTLALERLKSRAGLVVEASPPTVAFRETVRKPVQKRTRHKKQSGGHGEFGEVDIKVGPRPRGKGFEFTETIHGGTVPKQYIPAVQAGVEDALRKGPLGFPVVDVSVNLVDGKYHSVDSSEMAFRKAGSQAMREALSDAGPVLLEPINNVSVTVPEQFIAGIQKIILGHRGQIFGFEGKEGWLGWDEVTAQVPAAEMQNLIREIRSVTMGVGSFSTAFDHLQEISQKEYERIAGQA